MNVFTLLGVSIQNNLKWNAHVHVEKIIRKANKRLFRLRECRKSKLPVEIGIITYQSKIRPILERDANAARSLIASRPGNDSALGMFLTSARKAHARKDYKKAHSICEYGLMLDENEADLVALKPSFHMVVNVSRLCRKCRRDRVRVYLDDTCDTVATRSRPYGN